MIGPTEPDQKNLGSNWTEHTVQRAMWIMTRKVLMPKLNTAITNTSITGCPTSAHHDSQLTLNILSAESQGRVHCSFVSRYYNTPTARVPHSGSVCQRLNGSKDSNQITHTMRRNTHTSVYLTGLNKGVVKRQRRCDDLQFVGARIFITKGVCLMCCWSIV